MIIKKALLPLVFLSTALAFTCFGELLPGYVITHQGDTVSGLIDYRNWLANPMTITFQADLTADAVSYDPQQIREFFVAGERYLSATVEVYLQALSSAEQVRQSAPSGVDHFYIEGIRGIELLKYEQHKTERNGKVVLIDRNIYRNQLALYLADCSRIQQRLGLLRYDASKLESLFEEYYKCVDAPQSFQKKTEKAMFKMGLSRVRTYLP